MKKSVLLIVTLTLILSLSTLVLTQASSPFPDFPSEEDYVHGQLLVGLVESISADEISGLTLDSPEETTSASFLGVLVTSVRSLTNASEIAPSPQSEESETTTVETELGTYNGRQVLLIELASDSEYAMAQAINTLEQNSLVSHVSLNYITMAAATLTPNDPYFSDLWGMEKIEAPEAWNYSTGSYSVEVGVIDTGIYYDHPDLYANVNASKGYDFINYDPDAADDNGHGTHVAGTIGAMGNNGVGVVGVNWQVTMIPLKALDFWGYGTYSALIEAVVYAEYLQIPILNCSLGGYYDEPLLEEAINAYSGLFVAAAGNDRGNNDYNPFFPASYSCGNIISVAATFTDDEICDFYNWWDGIYWGSNYGETTVDIGAPGEYILSTGWPGNSWYPGEEYHMLGGTSMATPHVTGAAALLLAANPTLSTAEIKEAILATVDHSDYLEGLMTTEGRLNVARALEYVYPDIDADPYYEIINFHPVDLSTTNDWSLVGIGFDLYLVNPTPGIYDMEAVLSLDKGIMLDEFFCTFEINSSGVFVLPYLFDNQSNSTGASPIGTSGNFTIKLYFVGPDGNFEVRHNQML